MAETLLTSTSTLMVKFPDDVFLPAYQEKVRIRKTIIKTIISTLRKRQLELLYVGYKPDYIMHSIDAAELNENRTIVTINVLEDNGYMCDFNTSQAMLLKRFKRALQANSEHIIIDNYHVRNGFTERNIEIYIRSMTPPRKSHVPHYTLAVSSSYLAA